MTSCGHKNYEAFRSTFWILNFLFTLSAGGVIAVGVIKLLDVADFNDLVHPQIAPLQVAVIVIGSIQALLGFYGFLAIIIEIHFMLYGYIGVLSLIALNKFMLPIGWNLSTLMQNEFENIWDRRFIPENGNFIKLVQNQFQCCGFNGAHDYPNVDNLPASCCPTIYEDCNRANMHIAACGQMMRNWGTQTINQIQLAIGLMTILDVVIFIYVLFIMIPVLRLKVKQAQAQELERKMKIPNLDY